MSYFFFDTETTGIHQEAAIVQIGFIITNDKFVVTEEHCANVRLSYEDYLMADPEAAKITGFSYEEMLTKGRPFAEVVARVNESFKPSMTVIGQNVQFDIMLWDRMCRRAQLDNALAPFGKGVFTIDTKSYFYLRNKLDKNFPTDRCSLVKVAETLGIKTTGAHNALRDCQILIEVLRKFNK